METYTYICAYCSKEYTPRRRRVQKYCSSTCRVKAHFYRNKPSLLNTKKDALTVKNEGQNNSESQTKQNINMAGIGNAAIANIATDTLKSLFTHEDNKPLTKGDFKKLMAQFKNRYELVKNAPMRADGTQAYFDTEKKEIVYLKTNKSWNY